MPQSGTDDHRYIAEVAVRLHELERKEAERAATIDQLADTIAFLREQVSRVDEVKIANLQHDTLVIVERLKAQLVQVSARVDELASSSNKTDRRFEDVSASIARTNELPRRFDEIAKTFQALEKAWSEVKGALWWVVGVCALVFLSIWLKIKW